MTARGPLRYTREVGLQRLTRLCEDLDTVIEREDNLQAFELGLLKDAKYILDSLWDMKWQEKAEAQA